MCAPPGEAIMSSATTPLGRRLAVLEAEQAEQKSPAKRWRPPTALRFMEATCIEDKEHGGLVRFHPWPAQRRIVAALNRHSHTFILKSRQQGATWTILCWMLWAGEYWPNRSFLIVRQNFSEALDAIHRLKILQSNLPEEMRPQRVTTDNAASLWLANGSRYEALTSTERVARGRASYAALLDEFAFYDSQPEMLAAIEPSAARLIIATTGAGPGYAFTLWKHAVAGKSVYTPLFFDYRANPNRDRAWWVAHVEQAIEPRLARREYPSVQEDAWASPSGVYWERFDPAVNVADVQVSPEMRTVRAVDFGFRSAACIHAQIDSRGQVFIVSEYLPHNLTSEEFAEGILQRDRALGVKPSVSYVDPAGRAVSVATAESEVDVFKRAGLHPVSKPSSVRDGCLRLMSAFTDPDLPLVVSRSCPYLIEALSSVKPDRHRGEVYDEGSEYCHVLDSARYMVINLASKASYTFTPPKYIGAESWEHRLHRLEF
jgi:hypothetical protein